MKSVYLPLFKFQEQTAKTRQSSFTLRTELEFQLKYSLFILISRLNYQNTSPLKRNFTLRKIQPEDKLK